MTTSHSTRARGRHTQTRRTYSSSELGVLSEDALQDKVLEQDREIEQLRAQIMSLERQLVTRPPLKDVQNLELLLQGTQRENERCMADIRRGKERERMLEKELSNLLGEHWQRKLEFEYPSSEDNASTRIIHVREKPCQCMDNIQNQNEDGIKGVSLRPQSFLQHNDLASHLDQVRLLVLGMDQKLEEGEGRIRKLIEEAQRKSDALAEVGDVS